MKKLFFFNVLLCLTASLTAMEDQEALQKAIQASLGSYTQEKKGQHGHYQSIQLVIVLAVDADPIKQILPEDQKKQVISSLSLPSHVTIMWLKDLPANNPNVDELKARLKEQVQQFLASYKSKTGKDFNVVVSQVERTDGIYLIPTHKNHALLTRLILRLKQEVQAWHAEHPHLPVHYYKYFSGNQFSPHITLLETASANKIFSGYWQKNKFGEALEQKIQENKPSGYTGMPVSILYPQAWYQ